MEIMKLASKDNIRVINNFMEPEHVEELHRLCDESLVNPPEHGQEWWYHKFPGPEYTEYTYGAYRDLCKQSVQGYHDNKHPLLKYYMDKVADLISYEAGRKVVPIFHFNRHKSEDGVTCPGHTDAEGNGENGVDYMADYSPDHHYEPNLIEFSANIYLNNNYDDGRLYFPDYDVYVDHQPGQLVFFPGTVEYAHAVETVRGGTRWNLITHLARPKSIMFHSTIFNMWKMLSDDEKKAFPESWDDQLLPRGAREGNVK